MCSSIPNTNRGDCSIGIARTREQFRLWTLFLFKLNLMLFRTKSSQSSPRALCSHRSQLKKVVKTIPNKSNKKLTWNCIAIHFIVGTHKAINVDSGTWKWLNSLSSSPRLTASMTAVVTVFSENIRHFVLCTGSTRTRNCRPFDCNRLISVRSQLNCFYSCSNDLCVLHHSRYNSRCSTHAPHT